MTDEAFITSAVNTPHDDPARLVYADWLEEQGDPRGEFIRILAEMSIFPAYSDRFAELRARRNQLREQLDPDWIQLMGYTPCYRPLFSKLPAHRHERWRLVEEFIDFWYTPLQEGDGYASDELDATEARLGFKLPVALREWYMLAGKRHDVWSKQDWLPKPILTDG